MKELSRDARTFLDHCKYEKGLNEKTIKAYSIDLHQFHAFLKKEKFKKSIRKLDKETARRFVHSLAVIYETRSTKRKIATVKAFYNYLEFDELIPFNPFRNLRLRFKPPRTLPKIIPPQSIQKLLQELYRRKKRFRKKDRHLAAYFALVRDIAVIELLFATGIRVTELSFLRVQDVNLDIGSVKVHGKGSRDRLVPVCHPDSLRIVAEYRNLRSFHEEEDLFFINRLGQRYSEQSIRFMLTRYGREIGLAEKLKPHMFRHTLATLLLENGVDTRFIQTILGHSSILTTQIYVSVTAAHQRTVLNRKHPRVKMQIP